MNVNAFWITFPVGDIDTAAPAARQAVACARRTGCPESVSTALAAYARMTAESDSDEALAAADEALALVRSGAGGNAQSAASCTAALIRAARGDPSGAAEAIRAAVEHEARVGYRIGLAVDIAVATLVLAGDPGSHHAGGVLAGAITGPVLRHYPAFIGGNHQGRYDEALDQIVSYTLDHLAALAQRSATRE